MLCITANDEITEPLVFAHRSEAHFADGETGTEFK